MTAHTTSSVRAGICPAVPAADDPNAASLVLNEVLECIGALQDDLNILSDRHIEAAPASSVHVIDLTAAIARAVLDWIGGWPS